MDSGIEENDRRIYEIGKYRLTNDDVWLCLLAEVDTLSHKDVEKILLVYQEDSKRSVTELYQTATGKKIRRPFLDNVCFDYELKEKNNPGIDISPALNDLYDLCGIVAIRRIFEEVRGEIIRRFYIEPFGENYANVINSTIFESRVKPLLKKNERLRVAKKEISHPSLVLIE